MHDPKAYSKGGTLENTINGARAAPPPPPSLPQASDEEANAPQLIAAAKVIIRFCVLRFDKSIAFLQIHSKIYWMGIY